MPEKTRLILNERFLAFPFGQYTPAAALDAAFELGKKSALLLVDDNPFLYPGPRSLRPTSRYFYTAADQSRGAEAVAWLRGYYLACKASSESADATSIGLSGFDVHSSREAA